MLFFMPCTLSRPATPSVSRPVDPFISSRSRAPSAVSNLRADSPSDYNNGMGQRRYKHLLLMRLSQATGLVVLPPYHI
jgi:hypothetical protein